MDAIVQTKIGETKVRWLRAIKDRAFDLIRNQRILETHPEHFLAVLKRGTVATNVFLRRLHNFGLDMNWLPWPLIPKKQWPDVKYKPKRGITAKEHQQIVNREQNPERQAYYELCWYLGGSQGDLANLKAEDIDWTNRVIS